MGDGLFAPWHIIILVIVLVLIFGAARLPRAAQSLGDSMRIFRKSVQGLNPDDSDSAANPSAANPSAANPAGASTFPPPAAVTAAPPAPDSTQQQLADLQRQVADLQRQTAAGNGQPSEAQNTRPI
jgi:sec-independent protein translocase protein TatA